MRNIYVVLVDTVVFRLEHINKILIQ
jgi:hypothetical protein